MSVDKIGVLDKGSGFIKCGFASANFVTASFPACVGRPLLRATEKIGTQEIKDIMIGQECADNRAMLDVSYPITNGVVRPNDWSDFEILYRHALYDHLKMDQPGDHRVLFSVQPMAAVPNIAKEMELLFEKFGLAATRPVESPILALYCEGETTGMVVEVGDGLTAMFPVFEGIVLKKGVTRVPVGGANVTDQLLTLMRRRGYAFNKSADFDTVRQLKEKFCFVAADRAFSDRLAQETTVLERRCTLPDGRTITIGSERFEAAETIFSPHLAGIEAEPLGVTYYEAVQKVDMDTRKALFQRTVLSGGSTMFPGFTTRFKRDVTDVFVSRALRGDRDKLAHSSWQLRVSDPPRRKELVFLGGAVLTELIRDNMSEWVTKQDFAEQGAARCIERFIPRESADSGAL
eukprot:TRINITY_DN72244_c0_g1_i1.p1 TRINITY_DN72244_c0_g1~~TRINITY_DN72244_c0_g1_i1.p1  ORF type:complete len:442 (+),score=92.81 TRINITY_DN72244_c0_g1_i1:115-1326(+)